MLTNQTEPHDIFTIYCQAQPSFKFNLRLSLALISVSPTPTRASSEIAGNEQNLLSNIGRSTLVESKSILKILEKGKTTSMEDDLSGRRPQWKTTSVEDNLSRRRPQWKIISMEDDLI